MFPYYIVRFKRIFKRCVVILNTKFPYYIVRFKPIDGKYKGVSRPGFHTTQYDLNKLKPHMTAKKRIRFHTTQYDLNIIFSPCAIIFFNEFPYYIVRFKLFSGSEQLSLFRSFHTTQYDLNPTLVRTKNMTSMVSILHSTI